MPGGVNSPVRAFGSVGGCPRYICRGLGAYIWDVDGNKYVDYVGSWGSMILGHNHPKVREFIKKTLDCGWGFGAPSKLENTLAKEVLRCFPSMDRIRMVSSGTEASMSSIRLARGYTGRNRIVKFDGCYHGHVDSLLVGSGSGSATLGLGSNVPGVPPSLARLTSVLPYNDCEKLENFFKKHGKSVACIIIEPIAGNMNFVLPKKRFLKVVSSCCKKYQSVLILDEVMTGFRVDLGGAQSLFGIQPDLTVLGKIIGGGMPVGAFGGKRKIMRCLVPEGKVYQAGTLSGNPVAMACGLKTLRILSQKGFYTRLEKNTKRLVRGLGRIIRQEFGFPFYARSRGGMFGFLFSDKRKVWNFEDVKGSDGNVFRLFFHQMLKRGVYFAPSHFESGFVSSAHSAKVIENTLEQVRDVCKNWKNR